VGTRKAHSTIHHLAFLALIAPFAAGCGGDEAPSAEAKSPLSWTDCGGGLECATFEVPVDHEKPGGPRFKLPIVRRPAGDPAHRIGSLLVNPGGPGGSGANWVRAAWVIVPQAIKDRFDLVGFDPRGEAGSTPKIVCDDKLDAYTTLDLTPDDAAEKQALVTQTDAFIAGCEAHSKDILPFVGTDSIVKDMDALRAALGDEKMTFLGMSYGTFLGTVYAETYPDKVRALVLDAAIDPKNAGEEFIRGQAIGFEAQLDDFLTDCAGDAACPFHSNGDPAKAYDALQASIEASPLPAPPGGTRKLGPGQFAYGVSSWLYRPQQWPRLAQALAQAAAGDGSGILALSDGYLERGASGEYGNGLAVYYGVTSIDNTYAADVGVYQAMMEALRIKAPRLGVYLPYTALPAARWHVPPWRKPGPVTAPGAPPILVVGATRDPATPYPWAQSLVAQLEGSVLLTREGNGHVSFLRDNVCIDQAIVDYLVDLKLPAAGTVCK
jgi:pimeloyl-ACP methyl ester carboxylesterase